jgi:3-hydroxyphenylacetate 6-hydroxylase
MAFVSSARLSEDIWIYLPVVVFALAIIALAFYEVVRNSARVPGFKGPPGKPIFGNLWQIRQKDAPEQYRQWAKKYGPVYQIQLGNIPVLVVNSAAAAKAIFNQNLHATSSRPEFYTFHKVSPVI